MIVDKITNIKKIQLKSKRYDISVENNHNFFANNILVHNCQNLNWSEFYDLYQNEPFFATEKLDGTSSTFYYNNGEFGVCSRNMNLLESDENTYWKIARQYDLEEKMKAYGRNIALQGEIVGEGIQGNKYKLKGQQLFIFDIFDINKYEYMTYLDILTIIRDFNLRIVPTVSDRDFKLFPTVAEMLKYSEGVSLINPNIQREGIVLHPYRTINHRKYGRLSFKVINNKFLLDNKE